MKYKTLLIEKNNSITILTINRPEKLNALSKLVLTELKDFLSELKNENSFKVRGLILTGATEKSFIAGADIQEMSLMTPEEGESFSALAQDVTILFESLQIPVIGCVNGYALGGGCEMAISCDYIFATSNAVFGQPEVNLGLIPGFGGCVRLMRFIGAARAKEMIYTGRNIYVQEAEKIGLVHSVFSTKTEMIQAAIKSIQMILQKSSTAVALCKKVINANYGLTTEQALQIEKKAFREAFETEDKFVGVQAFLEKRKPEFSR